MQKTKQKSNEMDFKNEKKLFSLKSLLRLKESFEKTILFDNSSFKEVKCGKDHQILKTIFNKKYKKKI